MFNSLNSQYYEPDRWSAWSAGLLGGAIGVLVMGVFWYVQTKARGQSQALRQLHTGRQGQAPARSHIQLLSHPARQRHAASTPSFHAALAAW
jgi:hypothetical protein